MASLELCAKSSSLGFEDFSLMTEHIIGEKVGDWLSIFSCENGKKKRDKLNRM